MSVKDETCFLSIIILGKMAVNKISNIPKLLVWFMMNRIFSFFHLTASLLKLVFEHFHWDEQESISETRLIVPERQAWSKKEPTHLDVKRILLSLARGLSAHKVTNHSYSFLCIFLSFCCCLSISSTLPGTFAQYVLIELRCQRMLSSKLHGWLSKG